MNSFEENEYIVETGEMVFKEVTGESRIAPFKSGQKIKVFLGLQIDYTEWNGRYKYRVWWNSNEVSFHTSLEQSEQAIIERLVRE